jgi:small-conductance mechanosensitive channel
MMNDLAPLAFLPLAVALALTIVVLGLAHYLLLARHKDLGSEARLPRQLILLALTLAAIVLLVSVSPLTESTRNQVLALLGVLLSGVIALSSAPFVTNFMAAVMLRVTRPFDVGDFIRVGDAFGKVSERGLFDTEIQTENRELIALPNATFITQGVTVVRKSGVIISSQVSLGYEAGYGEVEPLLLQAAEACGLSDPFVHILALGDFSVQYRVAGLLSDVTRILTARSNLNQQILYTLHGAGVEIASPTITRHITQAESTRILPPEQPAPARDEGDGAEAIVFDKAREVELFTQTRAELTAQLEALGSEGSGTQRAETLRQQIAALQQRIEALQQQD